MAQNKNSKYFAQYLEKGQWNTISCYKYKKLRIQEPTRWENIKLHSKPIQGIRYNVHVRSSSSKFCFSGSGSKAISKNRMTTTHEFVTEVISKLNILNLKVNSHTITIKPETIIHEKERIKIYCTEKKEVFEYIPDLLIRFSNSQKLVKQWGGQIAIEVNVTHTPSDSKRKHFQFLGIPLLEIDATEELKFKFEGKDAYEESFKEYRNKLELILSKEINTSMKYPTYSNRSLGNKIFILKKDKEDLVQKLNLKIKESNNFKKEYKILVSHFESLRTKLMEEIDQKNSKLTLINNQLKECKNRHLISKIIDLFK